MAKCGRSRRCVCWLYGFGHGIAHKEAMCKFMSYTQHCELIALREGQTDFIYVLHT